MTRAASDRIPLYPTIREALIALYAIQTWQHALAPDGGFYAAGYFRKRTNDLWETAIKRENRRVSLRLAKMPCIVCGEALSENSTGDHIIPLSKGGPAGAQNYLPLCKSHNSSKGARDLFDWWQTRQGREVRELSPDVICCYSRLLYQWCAERKMLEWPAPDYLTLGLISLIETMPYDSRLYWFATLSGRLEPIE